MKKKILSLICCFAMMFVCLFTVTGCDEDPAVSNVWDGSKVTVSQAKNNIIKIETAEELAGLAKSVNEGNTYEGITIELTRDLNLNNIEWTPIGYGTSNSSGDLDNDDSYYFKGTFDGGNHTIKNLKVTTFTGGGFSDPTAATGVGLFGHTFNATIKNLTIDGARVVGNHFVATVAGFSIGTVFNKVNVKNADIDCVLKDENDNGDKAGLITGFACNNETNGSYITECSAMDSNVQANRDAGQLIGCFALYEFEVQTSCVEENNNIVEVSVSWNASGTEQGSAGSYIGGIIGKDLR